MTNEELIAAMRYEAEGCRDQEGEDSLTAAVLEAGSAALDRATRCSCPSGDGSLRWPCPKHPPEPPCPEPTAAQVKAARAEYDSSEDMERALMAAAGAAPQAEGEDREQLERAVAEATGWNSSTDLLDEVRDHLFRPRTQAAEDYTRILMVRLADGLRVALATPALPPSPVGEVHDCTGMAMVDEVESLKRRLDTHAQRADFWERRYKEAQPEQRGELEFALRSEGEDEPWTSCYPSPESLMVRLGPLAVRDDEEIVCRRVAGGWERFEPGAVSELFPGVQAALDGLTIRGN